MAIPFPQARTLIPQIPLDRAHLARYEWGANGKTAAPGRLPKRRFRSPRKHATVLVVEDDPGVRDLIARALSRGGYTTVTATNAEEARRIAQEMADPPDLVLADVVLPGGGGPELIAQIAAPGTRVLFMSGYSVDYFRGRGWKADVLEKPFTVHDLLHSVERTLTAAPGS